MNDGIITSREKTTVKSLREAFEGCSAFILDFDGVLANSEPMFRKSWNIALKPWGHSICEDDYWKYWSSLGHGIEGEISRRGLESIDVPLARKRQRETYSKFVDDGLIVLFPGVARLLVNLMKTAERGGKPFCIASNTPGHIVERILSSSSAPVPAVVGGEGLEKKPSPSIFLKAASMLPGSPSSMLVFEDSWKGITAAREGGFIDVLVLNDLNRNLEIESTYIMDGIGQLEMLIAALERERDEGGKWI